MAGPTNNHSFSFTMPLTAFGQPENDGIGNARLGNFLMQLLSGAPQAPAEEWSVLSRRLASLQQEAATGVQHTNEQLEWLRQTCLSEISAEDWNRIFQERLFLSAPPSALAALFQQASMQQLPQLLPYLSRLTDMGFTRSLSPEKLELVHQSAQVAQRIGIAQVSLSLQQAQRLWPNWGPLEKACWIGAGELEDVNQLIGNELPVLLDQVLEKRPELVGSLSNEQLLLLCQQGAADQIIAVADKHLNRAQLQAILPLISKGTLMKEMDPSCTLRVLDALPESMRQLAIQEIRSTLGNGDSTVELLQSIPHFFFGVMAQDSELREVLRQNAESWSDDMHNACIFAITARQPIDIESDALLQEIRDRLRLGCEHSALALACLGQAEDTIPTLWSVDDVSVQKLALTWLPAVAMPALLTTLLASPTEPELLKLLPQESASELLRLTQAKRESEKVKVLAAQDFISNTQEKLIQWEAAEEELSGSGSKRKHSELSRPSKAELGKLRDEALEHRSQLKAAISLSQFAVALSAMEDDTLRDLQEISALLIRSEGSILTRILRLMEHTHTEDSGSSLLTGVDASANLWDLNQVSTVYAQLRISLQKIGVDGDALDEHNLSWEDVMNAGIYDDTQLNEHSIKNIDDLAEYINGPKAKPKRLKSSKK